MNSLKSEFVKNYPNYGYQNQLNDIIDSEYPNLKHSPSIYLDNTACPPMPTKLMHTVADHYADEAFIPNPHSSEIIKSQIDQIRLQVLEFCKADPSEYQVVFCSNATSAIKLVGEYFPWHLGGQLLMSQQNHTSVVGLRQYAIRNGNECHVISTDELINFQPPTHPNISDDEVTAYNLMCFPAQCNWSGIRFNYTKDYSSFPSSPQTRTITLVDFASFASTSPIDLTSQNVDFAVISCYKVFGLMTGLSCLVGKKHSFDLLQKSYFGGGTVQACDIHSDYVRFKPQGPERWEDGTPNYLDILTLPLCLNHINNVFGGMSQIKLHCDSLSNWFRYELSNLKHFNGNPVATVYPILSESSRFDVGPTVAFNLMRSDGSHISLKHLGSIIELHHIIIRVGSLCNPGSNQHFLELTSSDIRDQFDKGIRCGDGEVGVCRASFGRVSRFEDAHRLLEVIIDQFQENEASIHHSISNESSIGTILERNIYPVKSCHAYTLPKDLSWPIKRTGFELDRMFKFVNLTTGKTLIQKSFSQLTQIIPLVDFENKLIQLNYHGSLSPSFSWETDKNSSENKVDSMIIDGVNEHVIIINSRDMQSWLQSTFPMPVALITSFTNETYPNQSPLLAIMYEELQELRDRLGLHYVPSNRFRSNLILKGLPTLKGGELIQIGKCEFQVREPCTRCSMITIDQKTAERDLKLYSDLVKVGSVQGPGKFGWYLELVSNQDNLEIIGSETVMLASH